MRRVPPSAVVHEEIDRLFHGGADRESNIHSELAMLGVGYLAQQGLEQEQEDFLGRGHYQRNHLDENFRGYRNGYEDTRLKTGEGAVPVRVPQVRGSPTPFRPKLLEFLQGNSEVLERLVIEMYARGSRPETSRTCSKTPPGSF